jgi:hypothetical protein
LHEGEEQGCYPEEVVVREQGEKRENRHELHLPTVAPVRNAIGQGMQLKVQVPYDEDDHKEHDDHCNEQNVGLPWSRNEVRQMMGRKRVW